MSINYILKDNNRIKFSANNYIRKADPKDDYWFDFSHHKLTESYFNKLGEDFNLIIFGDENNETDFYIIPYLEIKDILLDEFLSRDKSPNKKRWVGTIKNHKLKISNCPFIKDINKYYGNNSIINNKYIISKDEENDYAIENSKSEINIRLKQSLFRKKVLENFKYKCCISQITERNLLVASHIIPWAKRIDSRLDPQNGLCLFTLYDQLFDQGYISFSDQLKIITVKKITVSDNLRIILESIDNIQASIPEKMIKAEYLSYHRNYVFLDSIP